MECSVTDCLFHAVVPAASGIQLIKTNDDRFFKECCSRNPGCKVQNTVFILQELFVRECDFSADPWEQFAARLRKQGLGTDFCG